MKITLFEDSAQYESSLLVALNNELAQNGQALLFKAVQSGDAIYEERLENDLVQITYQGAQLIVADRDLSKLSLYGGLSEPTVRRVADKLGIPECGYARGEREVEFLHNDKWRESRIAVTLDGNDQQFAKQVVSIGEGFKFILEALPTAMKLPGKKSVGKILSTILGKPEYGEKIALYASGDQNRLTSVFAVGKDDDQGARRLSCLLGYWLWDSVLRYPGVFVNEVAASSYLDIKAEVFGDSQIQQLFQSARYQGPFAGAKAALWWRGMLDDIVAGSAAPNGREFAVAKLNREIHRSECCEDPQKSAGYYCMLSGKPVSLDNSKPGVTWFPRGADLARISSRKYEEDVPWL